MGGFLLLLASRLHLPRGKKRAGKSVVMPDSLSSSENLTQRHAFQDSPNRNRTRASSSTRGEAYPPIEVSKSSSVLLAIIKGVAYALALSQYVAPLTERQVRYYMKKQLDPTFHSGPWGGRR